MAYKLNICTVCGSTNLKDCGNGVYKCCSCDATFRVESGISGEEIESLVHRMDDFDSAERELDKSPPDFDEAERLFRLMTEKYPSESMGYWGLMRAKFGIKFERDSGKAVPSCYISSYEDVRNSEEYKKAIQYAESPEIRQSYERWAAYIADVAAEWREKAQKYSYDIFISFKNSDENGGETQDTRDMRDLYDLLRDKGYSVFFSSVTLQREGYGGTKSEPYIFNALDKAKVLIVYGSKAEYFSNTWVQNEWRRYLRAMERGEKGENSLLVVYREGVNYKSLPQELRPIQGIKYDLRASEQILYAVENAVTAAKSAQKIARVSIKGREKRKAEKLQRLDTVEVGRVKEAVRGEREKLSVRSFGSRGVKLSASAESKLSIAENFLERGNFVDAEKNFDTVLMNSPRDGRALTGKLFALSRSTSLDNFIGGGAAGFNDFSVLEKTLSCAEKQVAEGILLGLCGEAERCFEAGNVGRAKRIALAVRDYDSPAVSELRAAIFGYGIKLIGKDDETAKYFIDTNLSFEGDEEEYVNKLHTAVEKGIVCGQFDFAKYYAEKLKEADGTAYSTQLALLETEYRTGGIDNVLRCIEENGEYPVIESVLSWLDSDSAEEWLKACFSQIKYLLENGHYDGALRWIDICAKYKFSSREKILNSLLDICIKNASAEAAECFERLLGYVADGNSDVYAQRALSFADSARASEQFETAEQFYEKVLLVSPENIAAAQGKFFAYIRCRNEEQLPQTIANLSDWTSFEDVLRTQPDDADDLAWTEMLVRACMANVDENGASADKKVFAIFEKLLSYIPEKSESSLIKLLGDMARICLERGLFENAEKFFNMLLGENAGNSENAAAYWGLLHAKLKCRNENELIKFPKPIVDLSEFENALICAADNKTELNHYIDIRDRQSERIKNAKRRRRAVKISAIAIASAIVLGGAAGGFVAYYNSQSGLIYGRNNEGYTVSAGRFYSADEQLIIPEEYNGQPVVAIDENGFAEHTEIEQLVLPESVVRIEEGAFAGCVNLTGVTVSAPDVRAETYYSEGGSLEYIGARAFEGCSSLAEFSFEYGLEYVGERAFADTAFTQVSVPGTVNFVGAQAFYGCESLAEIIVGDREELPAEWAQNWNEGCDASVDFRLRVVLDYNGATSGPSVGEEYVSYGREFELPVPVRSGYSFDGWYSGDAYLTDSSGRSISAWQSQSGGILTAKWVANINTLAFDSNGGEGEMDSLSIATDGEATLPQNAFTRAGYTFAGWSTTPNGSAIYADQSQYTMGPSSSYTLYAVWQANINELVFDSNGGEGEMYAQKVSTDNTVTLNENTFIRTGYTFAGWTTSPNGSVIYADQSQYTMGTEAQYTLYAVWEPTVYSIEYILNGGAAECNPEAYTIEDDSFTLNNPVRAGYTFAGWKDSDEGEPTLNITIPCGSVGDRIYIAVWTPNENRLIFHAHDGSEITGEQIIHTDETAALKLNTFSRNGYAFAGWAEDENGEVEYSDGANYTMGTESEYTLYAVWKAVNYSISYDLNGGTAEDNPDYYTIESRSFTLNAPVRAGYTFAGWTGTDIGEATQTVTIIQGSFGDREYVATWTANRNSLIFDPNGGEGEMPEQVISTDSSAPLTANMFTRAGYSFVGWTTTPEGDVMYADCADYLMRTEAQYALYAVWSPNLNAISFDGNGADGGEMDDISAHTDEVIMLPENTYAKTGYTFIGWATEQNGEVAYEDGAQCTVGTEVAYTLYAVWAANEYLVTLDAVGGEIAEDTVAVRYDSAYQLPVPFRTGYEFIGWYDGTGESAVAYTDSQGNSLQNWTETYDKILYAKYTPNLNVIIFNANGGTGDMANVTGYSDSEVRLPANNYTYNGYEFVGWSDSADGRVLYYERDLYPMGTNSSYILYTQWRPEIVDSDVIGYTAIYTAEDLNNIRNDLDGNYYLAADIDLDGIVWEPVGTESNPFTGVFDGRGHAIINMRPVASAIYYNDREIGIIPQGNTADMYYYLRVQYGAGLFGYCENSAIRNLNILDFVIEIECEGEENDVQNSNRRSYVYYVGAIGARGYQTTIDNCYSKGTIALNGDDNNRRYAGGICGGFCTVTNSDVDVTITSTIESSLGYISGTSPTDEPIVLDNTQPVSYVIYMAESGDSVCQWVPGRSIINLFSAIEELEGYTFGGWALTEGGEKVYDAGDEFYFEEGQNEITLYPVWLPHKIVFDSNGGSGVMEALVVEPGTSVELPNCSFNSPNGYYFVGWTTVKDGEVEYTAGQQFTMPSEDIFTVTLYAVWAAIE